MEKESSEGLREEKLKETQKERKQTKKDIVSRTCRIILALNEHDVNMAIFDTLKPQKYSFHVQVASHHFELPDLQCTKSTRTSVASMTLALV